MSEPQDEFSALYRRIDSLSQSELDDLPHGTIQLDEGGKIMQFNMYESKLANLERAAVIGKNFFKDVAPCTDVKEFFGRFKEGVAAKKLYEKFRYHFAFKQDPRNVLVTLFYSDKSQSVWVFVQPM